jgi:hypothetical protein
MIKLIDTEKQQTDGAHSYEHRLYADRYQKLKNSIFENRDYEGQRDYVLPNGNDLHRNDLQEVENFYRELSDIKNLMTPYNKGLIRIIENDV